MESWTDILGNYQKLETPKFMSKIQSFLYKTILSRREMLRKNNELVEKDVEFYLNNTDSLQTLRSRKDAFGDRQKSRNS